MPLSTTNYETLEMDSEWLYRTYGDSISMIMMMIPATLSAVVRAWRFESLTDLTVLQTALVL